MKKFVDYLPFIGTLAFLIGYMYHMEALNIVMGLSYVLWGILKRRETKKQRLHYLHYWVWPLFLLNLSSWLVGSK